MNPNSTKKILQLQHKFRIPTTLHTNAPKSNKINHHQLTILQKNYVFQSNHNSLLLNFFSLLNIASSLNLTSNWQMCCRANKTTLGEDKTTIVMQNKRTSLTSTKTMTLSVIVAFLHSYKSLKPKP